MTDTLTRVLADRVPRETPDLIAERAAFAQWFRQSQGYIAFSRVSDGAVRCNGSEAASAWAAWLARAAGPRGRL